MASPLQRNMASQSSIYVHSIFSIPMCDCNEIAVLKMSHTNVNPGRRFLGCARFGVSNYFVLFCSWFRVWVLKLGKKFWLTFDKLEGNNHVIIFSGMIHHHLKRALTRMINRAKEAELQRDKAQFKARILMLVVVVLSVIIVMQFIYNRFH